MGLSGSYKKSFMVTLLVVFLLLPGLAMAGIATEVVVNKSVLLNLRKPVDRVAIAAPAIAELIVISPTQLQINGSRIGATSLIVWEKGGKTTFFDIRVKGDVESLERQIREIAPNDSITVDYANDTIVLAGKATNDQTIEKAVQLAKAYAAKDEGSSQDLASPFPAHTATTEMKGYDAVEKNTANDSKVKVLNHIVVDNPLQVLLEVKVAQVDRDALKSLGISVLVKGNSGEGYSNLVGAPDSGPTVKNQYDVSNSTPGILGNSTWLGAFTPLTSYQLGGSLYKSGLGGVLKALASKNLAKLLAEPNLLVKSGQEGQFLSGEKYYYPVVTANTTDIKEIPVGVKLRFKPEVLENGLIRLRISPAEVSSVSGTLTSNGYNTPIVTTREIRSEVQLKNGESLVLGGLLSEEATKTMSKIPILGDVPILGALFRSTKDDLTKKELVFFITPKIVSPNPPGQKQELPTDKPLTPEEEKEFRWIPKK